MCAFSIMEPVVQSYRELPACLQPEDDDDVVGDDDDDDDDDDDRQKMHDDGDEQSIKSYVETENIFLDYLKSITFASLNDDPPEMVSLPDYDAGSESGLEALNRLYQLLETLCNRTELTDVGSTATQTIDSDRRKQDLSNKTTSKYLSSHYSKDLRVKTSRGRSHSSIDVEEILRTQQQQQDTIDMNASESRRKSRRVSLGMRPKFSNWSKVKGAFKRDKSNSRIDSRDDELDYCSGDEATGGDKMVSQFSPSHENLAAQTLSSSEEDFEFYTDGYSVKKGSDAAYGIEYEISAKNNDAKVRNNDVEKALSKSKSAVLTNTNGKSCNSPNINNPSHKNVFKWYRTKNATAAGIDCAGPQDGLSLPPSPYENTQFLYDDDSINKVTDDHSGQSANECNEMLLEVHNKYESLQKRLSREFYEKYHDQRAPTTENDSKSSSGIDLDDPKLSSLLNEQNLSPSFKQKFHEWQKIKGLSVSPTRLKRSSQHGKNDSAVTAHGLKKSKSDWHKWRPGSKSESNVLKFLERDQPNDASSSLCVVNVYGDDADGDGGPYYPIVKSKKQSIDLFGKHKNVVANPLEKKELAWLEKELQKVAREKQRLEKEKEKYAERETRLRNMKRAIKSGRKRKQEVLVPTSAGLFRFQGISSKFTRKLYEWEKVKGITAESSTFALLNSHYGGLEVQRNNKLLNNDMASLLSRSRSVGSVEVTGVGNSLIESDMDHHQSSLSLNDMEQLEEAQLQVENDNLMRSTSQLYEKENDNDLDLLSAESLVIPDYAQNVSSRGMPSKSLRGDSKSNDLQNICFAEDGKYENLSDGEAQSSYCPYQSDTNSEVLPNKEQRKSANEDAEHIVDQIKKLRAGTSIDDEDRMNNLTNLQHLADQLLQMVHMMNDQKNENVDELAGKIAHLAVALKKELKILTSENVYTDTEDNDSPTVQCTFTLPSRRMKYATPSSTESESSNTRKKYPERLPKTDRQNKHHFHEADNSSGGDENYDGSDETTLYHLAKRSTAKNKGRRESSDISTSNSESIFDTESKSNFVAEPVDLLHERQQPTGGNVMHCSLTLDPPYKGKVRETVPRSRIINSDSNEIEREDNDRQSPEPEIRSYSPKPISSKRKCSICGKIKRISKSRKNLPAAYCVCGRKEISERTEVSASKTVSESAIANNVDGDRTVDVTKSASYSNGNESSGSARKMGKLFRSKVYDFNALKNGESVSAEMANAPPHSDPPSVNVIVPTTRKIFAPLRQDEHGGTSAVVSYIVDESSSANNAAENILDCENKVCNLEIPSTSNLRSKSVSPSIHRKDLVISPAVFRRREVKRPVLELDADVDKLPPTSPISIKRPVSKDNANNCNSIRMMIAHYNKLTDYNGERRSSDGNCWSPTLQKSPVTERRTRFEYFTGVQRTNDGNGNIRKSKSAALLAPNNQKLEATVYNSRIDSQKLSFNIAKSSSAGSIRCDQSSKNNRHRTSQSTTAKFVEPTSQQKKPNFVSAAVDVEGANANNTNLMGPATLELDNSLSGNVLSETKLRNLRLREAKNRFFNNELLQADQSTIGTPPKTQLAVENKDHLLITKPKTNKTEKSSSTETEAGFSMALNKSISTGAIDDRTRNCDNPVKQTEMRSCGKSKFGFSSIASKFRKVKMRRHRDPEVSAVSSLCKASLSINLGKDVRSKDYQLNSSKSCPSSPVIQRSMSKRNSSSN